MQLEIRIKILIEQNRKLNVSLKEKINENEEQRITIAELEMMIHNLKNQDDEILRYKELLN